MKFSKEFFQHIRFEKTQIERFFKKAGRDLEIAKESGHNEVILHFCYNAIIQLGISAIAEKGYKIRSIPGHHVKLLEKMASLLDCPDEIDYLQKVRQKRNIDMYEGGSTLTDKQASDLLRITENLFKKYTDKKKKNSSKSGFTLVELMVSVGITAILMVGISTFFSSTFRNMFTAREKVTNSQGQFVINTILGGKFANVGKLQQSGPGGSYAVLRNNMNTGDMPFTYIGKERIDGTEHIVFKDFFVFNGREGNVESQTAVGVNNPGGLTKLNGKYYLTAPLENKIYECTPGASPLSSCSDLGIQNLNRPMDITDNGKPPLDDMLYVTDAGNNRIVKIEDPTGRKIVSETVGDFNFPTGIEYYKAPDNIEYLFVADTYNHVVKKIKISDGTSAVVVGNGDDTVCDPFDGRDHSAIFCKLSFPTGVLVADDGNGDALYIADTGNERVLKVSDPNPDLSSYKLPFSLVGSTKISRVDFVLPNGSTINSASESSENTLHPIKLSVSSPTITASLTGWMTGSYMAPVCSGGPSPTCTNYFRGFYVDSDNNIFQEGDDLDIEGKSFKVTNVSDEGVGSWKISIKPVNTISEYSNDTDVSITNDFSGDYSFSLNLSDITFPGGFNLIKMEAYDRTAILNNDPPDFQTLRIGDGELGTFEDTIEVVSGHDNDDFPTGLGWYNNNLRVSGSPQYSPDFSDYDYISDFEVRNFKFATLNSAKILELTFQANLGKNAGGDVIWDKNTLNASIK